MSKDPLIYEYEQVLLSLCDISPKASLYAELKAKSVTLKKRLDELSTASLIKQNVVL